MSSPGWIHGSYVQFRLDPWFLCPCRIPGSYGKSCLDPMPTAARTCVNYDHIYSMFASKQPITKLIPAPSTVHTMGRLVSQPPLHEHMSMGWVMGKEGGGEMGKGGRGSGPRQWGLSSRNLTKWPYNNRQKLIRRRYLHTYLFVTIHIHIPTVLHIPIF